MLTNSEPKLLMAEASNLPGMKLLISGRKEEEKKNL